MAHRHRQGLEDGVIADLQDLLGTAAYGFGALNLLGFFGELQPTIFFFCGISTALGEHANALIQSLSHGQDW